MSKTYNVIYHTFQYVKVSNSMTIHFRKWYEKVTVACLFFGKEIWDRVPPLFFFFLLFNQCKFIILTAFICVLLFCALLSLWFSGSHHHHLRVTSLHIFINYLTAAFLNDPQLYVSCVGTMMSFHKYWSYVDQLKYRTLTSSCYPSLFFSGGGAGERDSTLRLCSSDFLLAEAVKTKFM